MCQPGKKKLSPFDRSVFFFLTELFFSAKIVARSVLFPFIVEAAEIFVKFEEKVFNKLKERFIKNKTGW